MSGQRCPVCGYQNPAGGTFCQSCGNPLPDPEATRWAEGRPPAVPIPSQSGQPAPGWAPHPAPPVFPAPPTTPAPVPPPAQPAHAPQVFSPYYHPAGMPPTVSRTSPGLIVGIAALALVALVVLSLAGFLVVRNLASRPQATNPRPGPVASPVSGPVPSPSAGPTAPPTSAPTGGGGNTVTTSGFSLVPGGFQVSSRSDTEVDLRGSAGGLAVAAGRPNSPTTTASELGYIQQQLEARYGALDTCLASQTFTIGGKSGTLEGWQYADTDSSGNQVQVCDAYWVDAPSNGNLYEYEQVGPSDTWNSDLEPAAQPVRDSIQWLI